MKKEAENPGKTEPHDDPCDSESLLLEMPKGVFIKRAPGMSLEEFKEFCIRRFREAGLIKN